MSNLKRILAVVAIVAVFGGGSLGVGLSLGLALGRLYASATYVALPESQVLTTQEYPVAFAFADRDVDVLPIEVRVSNITSVVQAVSGSVVSINIEVPSANRFFRAYNPGSGSGIIFAEDEDFIYIATNFHVVYRAARIGISLDDEHEKEATLIGGDFEADLAVLAVLRSELGDMEYHVAVFGDSDRILVGDEVVAIGNPMGQGQTATRGIVSAINRQITVDGRTLNVLQTDAAINPGNSGGALANIQGEVIGINTAKAISFHIEGMGYAIPSNEALGILTRLLEEGTAPRPYLGISFEFVSEQTRQWFALPSVGIVIRFVQPYSPAYEAGIAEGDLVVSFNGEPVETPDALALAMPNVSVGDEVTLGIYRIRRDGIEPMEVTIVVGDANAR